MAASAFDPRRSSGADLAAALRDSSRTPSPSPSSCSLSFPDRPSPSTPSPSPCPSSPAGIIPGLRPIVTKPSRAHARARADEDADADVGAAAAHLAARHSPNAELVAYLARIYEPAMEMHAKLDAARRDMADIQRRHHEHVLDLEAKLQRAEGFAALQRSRIRELEHQLRALQVSSSGGAAPTATATGAQASTDPPSLA